LPCRGGGCAELSPHTTVCAVRDSSSRLCLQKVLAAAAIAQQYRFVNHGSANGEQSDSNYIARKKFRHAEIDLAIRRAARANQVVPVRQRTDNSKRSLLDFRNVGVVA